MSLFNDYAFAEVTSFGGANLLTDDSMVGTHQALLAQNVEFSAGSVGTRHGYATIPALPTTTANIFELYNWIAPFSQITSTYADSALVTISSSAPNSAVVSIINLNTTTASGLMVNGYGEAWSVTTAGASFIGVGMRLYHTVFNNVQHGSGYGAVITIRNNAGTVASTVGSLFKGPSPFAPAATEPAAGLVTAGVHRLGYLIEFIDGSITRVCPDAGTVFGVTAFAPISVTASGSRNLRLSFTLNWNSSHPSLPEMVAVSVIMTTTTNLNQYYVVPGSRTPLASTGSTAAFTVDFSISDADLSSQAKDAAPYLYRLTQGANNSTTGGFIVRHLSLFGSRMAYLATQADNAANTIDALYVSDPNDYQSITADQHVLQLPGQKPIVTMFRMGAVNYILGPHEIWAATDNNNVPASWAAPQLLDGRHGTQSIHGIEVAPSGNYAWIADQGGLYLFMGGPITSLPVSYYQTPDWNRINWGAAYCVKIRDDAGNKRVHVLVPLDGASTPSHIMTWDYTNGTTPDQVMYSLDNILGYTLGAIELVRNDLLSQAQGNTGKVELWAASSGTAAIIRKTSDVDTHPYRDLSTGIASTYYTCPLPGRGVSQGQILMHHGFYARIKGSGAIAAFIRDIDSQNAFTCRAITLSATPNKDELCIARMRNELCFIEFSTSTMDTHWTLSYLRSYYSPYLEQR